MAAVYHGHGPRVSDSPARTSYSVSVPRTFTFPPRPRGMRGRARELATLEHTIALTAPARLALVGSGGSGKSMLAAALGHRMKRRFAARLEWFRVGRWDHHTLLQMMALRFGTSRDRDRIAVDLRAFLTCSGERLVVFDNHEDDAVTARLLDILAGTPTTFVVT